MDPHVHCSSVKSTHHAWMHSWMFASCVTGIAAGVAGIVILSLAVGIGSIIAKRKIKGKCVYSYLPISVQNKLLICGIA